jgi:hypothetical protein
MDSEIVFTGLCSILNPDGENKKMGDPAVILVQTPNGAHGNGHGHGHGNGHADEHHLAYLAFDPNLVNVEGIDGSALKPVDKGPPFVFMTLPDGVELSIKDNPPGPVTPLDSYKKNVAHRDEYWPEAKGRFDPAFVPPPGKRPEKTAVKAWMRFGKGKLSASRISKVPWRFMVKGKPMQRRFAEEVVYSGFPHSEDAVVIELKDLEDPQVNLSTLRFSLKPEAAGSKLTLIIGNNAIDDMAASVTREITEHVKVPNADHFKFLNRTAGNFGSGGPVPLAINPPPPPVLNEFGGGSSGGACGPGSGNGGG